MEVPTPNIGTAGEWAQFGLASLVIFALFTFGGLIVLFVMLFLRSMEAARTKREGESQEFLENCMANHRTERAELVGVITKISDGFHSELAKERHHREVEAEKQRAVFECRAICPICSPNAHMRKT